MLRVRFSASDLETIRISVSPAFQTVTLALTAGSAEPAAVHAARDRLVRRAGRRGGAFAGLLELDGSHVPDFLTPSPTTEDVSWADELEIAASAPEWRRARDARHLESHVGRSAIADGLVAGDAAVGRRVLEGLMAFHHAAYGDSWTEVRRRLRAEADRRRRELDVFGVDHVLSTIHPSVRWRRPVLTISDNSYDGDYERTGQGLVLVPALGRLRTVTTMINPWEPVTIGYPVSSTPLDVPPVGRRDLVTSPQLSRLLGSTRARVLTTIETRPDLTTTQLATCLGISVASASEHASALRAAGLVTSGRDRNAVRHGLTPLGSGLVRAAGRRRTPDS
ncbi:MAG TPA: winged helix-turn-helix domain-containing protein [Nocardioides sp.]|jgi:DNA-binding transcriptional ArsR family regulator|nr:winged helix-turn-helix domain-containing protein [Nocardioides sp.]